MNTLGGAFLLAIKGQKFKTYPASLKREAVRLHVEERWTHREVAVHLGINDLKRVKLWVRRFREEGEDSFVDRRGNPHRAETAETRKIRSLVLEVDVLKKWLEILNEEVR
jgi:transposase-like protein